MMNYSNLNWMVALITADEAHVVSVHDYELTLEYNYKPGQQIFDPVSRNGI